MRIFFLKTILFFLIHAFPKNNWKSSDQILYKQFNKKLLYKYIYEYIFKKYLYIFFAFKWKESFIGRNILATAGCATSIKRWDEIMNRVYERYRRQDVLRINYYLSGTSAAPPLWRWVIVNYASFMSRKALRMDGERARRHLSLRETAVSRLILFSRNKRIFDFYVDRWYTVLFFVAATRCFPFALGAK